MIYFLDFEASSLMPGSFPIEIAWVDQNGQGEGTLIRPAPAWLTPDAGVPEWSAASERIHGISLSTLADQGAPVERVAARAVQVLAPVNAMVFSDSPAFDGHWLERLLEAANIRQRLPVLHVHQLYGMACRPLLTLMLPEDGRLRQRATERIGTTAKEIVAAAEDAERSRPRVRHRALPDAEGLWRTWRAIQDEVARQIAEGTPQ